MVKGNPKSSATSATRKKHAKKHAPPEDVPQTKDSKKGGKSQPGKGGKKNKEPRVKMYIPPVKPPPVQPDPLETTGLAHTLPADLLVVLRNLSKKAQVTKVRALEDLQNLWVEKYIREKDEVLSYTLVEMLPVWLHYLPALFLNPSRRVRLLTTTLHSSFLSIPDVRDRLLFFMRETASSSQTENILGTWCLAANDVDRSIASIAYKTWEETITTTSSATGGPLAANKHIFLDETGWSSLISFIQRAALDPGGIYLYFNPVALSSPPVVVHPYQSKKGSAKGSQVSTPRRDDGDQTPRTKIDEQEENDQDRKSRLRIGALGAAKWLLGTLPSLPEDLISFYSNPALWTVLCSRESCPWVDMESFGFAQPNVRKAAWVLLQSLITSHKDELTTLLPTLSTATLRSAWVETDATVQGVMWPPLLTFLKEFSQSWVLDLADGDDSSDSEDDSRKAIKENRRAPEAYEEFLQFLELGCSGSPVQGYPTVIIVLSTIPASVIQSSSEEPLSRLFTSFWAAVDGRALSSLHRIAASSAFLSSLLECLVFLLRRIHNSGESSQAFVDRTDILVKDQFSRVWTEVSTQRLNVEEKAVARLIGQTLETLIDLDHTLFDAAWETLAVQVKTSSRSEKEEQARLVSVVLKGLLDRVVSKKGNETQNELRLRVSELVREVLSEVMEGIEGLIRGSSNGKANSALLVNLLEQFQKELFVYEDFALKFDHLLSEYALKLLLASPQLLLSYLLHRRDEAKCLSVWHSLLSSIASSQTPDLTVIRDLLQAAQRGKLPQYLKPRQAELEGFVNRLLDKALSGPTNSNEALILKQILVSAGHFLSHSGFIALLQTILDTYTSNMQSIVQDQNFSNSVLDVTIDLIEVVFSSVLQNDRMEVALLPAVFLHAYLLPICSQRVEPEIVQSRVAAATLWEKWLKAASEAKKRDVVRVVVGNLRRFMTETSVYPSAQDILQLVAQQPPGLQINLLEDIFPSSDDLDAMFNDLPPDPIDSSLAVLDDLLPTTFASKSKVSSTASADRQGLTPYSRIVNGLSLAFLEDRQLAKHNLWALRHLLALSVYAQDSKNMGGMFEHTNPVFSEKTTPTMLEDVVDRVRQISVYLFKSMNISGDGGHNSDDNVWKHVAVERFFAAPPVKQTTTEGFNDAQRFLFNIISHAKEKDDLKDTRILKIVLQSLLADGTSNSEADLWIQLARKFERTAPETSMTIISVLISRGAELPRLDRYRNELAASLLGIKPHKANTEGLLTLRKLAAASPDQDGDVVFLPTPRAVNVLKALQTWALAEGDEDDELNEEVESAMLPIFMHLAPILQTVSGAHWPFMFDLLESVLERSFESEEESESYLDEDEKENKSQEKGSTLVALARALRFVLVIEELAGRNKSLMEEWKPRRMNIMKSIINLGISRHGIQTGLSRPFSVCRELVLSALTLHSSSSTLFDEHTLSKMVHLLQDSSYKVQKMAYALLKEAAKKRTEYFVIEVGVRTGGDEEEELKATLPTELVELLMKDVDLEEDDEEEQISVFGYLLAWMLVFDSFENASFKVRSSYIDQIKSSNAIINHFIPCLLALLRLDRGGLSKAFKLDIWGVDAFYVDLYEPGNPHTIPVLAAYVYYRALLTVPSIIRGWVLDCKDRQLMNAMTVYTSTYFSPVLIKAELNHVKANATNGELVDEKMNVKVLSSPGSAGSSANPGGSSAGVGGEVVVSYSVDEHQLEIRIRIPSDWPLHRVEVKDVKRVGVDENRWRAWVLGVQQTIWAHNGRILDGLSLFKKNVTLHFEGQVECAICYSIISVMDGSLPKKPCKTCKNRFHAGCLYKWFNTSHSSSCPLCRSDFI